MGAVGWGGRAGALGDLEQVLLGRNLTLNSDAAPNYKYMFGLHTHLVIS